ncbi:MAG TPA: type III-B CRISPR module-associated Cmr3 family protein [Streptosporangiaceae bacterium]|nr:type III-B CRISPR module-associated Cmr3 family protein [Streptosporangiaceae bacterium]
MTADQIAEDQTTAEPWIAFVPRDTVIIRDGRPFDATGAESTSAEPVLPGPATMGGALKKAFGKEPVAIRGPVLARRLGEGWEPHFPVPADLIAGSDEPGARVFRLVPEKLDGWTDLTMARSAGPVPERWLVPPHDAEPGDALTGWLPEEHLTSYLAGELPGDRAITREQLRLQAPLKRERRIGLARDGRTARTGFLYQSAHLRPCEDWAFLAQYENPAGERLQAGGPVPFGGRGRLADAEQDAACRWPKNPEGCVNENVLVYLATPAVWPTGWCPPLPSGAHLVAAVTGQAEPVAMLTPNRRWKDAKPTRALRWAVPAGSVFLLRFDTAEAGARWAKSVHGTAYGRDDNETLRRLRTAGFGVVLTGVWT